MTTKSDKMTSVRVPKEIVKIVDDLRSKDILCLSQGQMLSKAVIALKNFTSPNPQEAVIAKYGSPATGQEEGV